MTPPSVQSRDWSVLELLQFILLCTLLVVCATTLRSVLWTATQQQDLFPDFQGILLFLSDYALIGIAALTLLRLIVEPDYRRDFAISTLAILRRYGGVWWAALVVWMAVSAAWSQYPRLALYDAANVLAALVAALVAAHFVRIGAGRSLLIALGIGAAVQSVIGFGQILHGGPLGLDRMGEIRWVAPISVILGPINQGLYRANGLTVNPNNLAGYLMVALFGLLVVALDGNPQQRWSRPLTFFGLFVVLVGLLATMSRSALVPVALSIILLAAFQVSYQRFRLRREHLLYLVGAAAVVVIGAAILLPNIKNRVFNLWEDVEERGVLTDQANVVIQQFPYLGTGAANLMLHVEQNRLRDDPHAELVAAVPAHNVYVIILAELGPVGLILFLLGCASSLIRLRWRTQMPVLIWACCALAICLAMLFDFYFWYDHRSRALFFFALGMGWAYTLAAKPAIEATPEAGAIVLK